MENNETTLGTQSKAKSSGRLSHWENDQLERFLRLRQELFLDPIGSNRKRFEEAAVLLQRALFAWYFSMPGKFPGLLSWVQQHADETRQLRKEELSTLQSRRFSLHVPAPDIPAIESDVSENQWQKIFGSFNTSYKAQRLFERFLTELDEYTNPSLRINHRYLGELLPHDNMVSYFAATVATFLNENAIIGKVSPCVTHMELAAINRLAQLVGWEGKLEISEPKSPDGKPALPLQRLPTPYPPAQNSDLWEREQPIGTIVGDGTIANISALLIARNATFNYLLGWGEAVQGLGPDICWQIIKEVYGYERMVVVTSKGAHYSVPKAAYIAGVGPLDVIEVAGSENPWILDKEALGETLRKITAEKTQKDKQKNLLLAVVAIAGKTETGYIDRIKQIATVLEDKGNLHPDLDKIIEFQEKIGSEIEKRVGDLLSETVSYQEMRAYKKKMLLDSYRSSQENPKYAEEERRRRLHVQVEGASYNRPFLHVDAAHGGAFLTVPYLRNDKFKGIHLADTITLDGHKMFYCYYPCGGLLIRTTRWARTFNVGHSTYISEDTSHDAYGEDRWYLESLMKPRSPMFCEDDIKDSSGLANKLQENNPLSEYLRGKISEETKRLIEQSDASAESLKSALVGELNKLLKDDWLYDEQRFKHIELTEKIHELIQLGLRSDGLIRLNRLLLEAAYPNILAKSPKWQKRKGTSEMPLIYPGLYMGRKEGERLNAARSHNNRPAMTARSELRHLPYTASLEGSRGCQGIMQMYFNLSTFGFDGYRSLLEWAYLLTRRCAEAVSLGRVYVRPVTEKELVTKEWMGNGKDWAIQYGVAASKESDHELESRRIVPVLGGRLLRLSDGSCNQLLISYVPRDIAMRISSQGESYWKHQREGAEHSAEPGSTNFWHVMHYLWRVNEHLWVKYLYANPAFTYYVGHTEFVPILPNKDEEDAERKEAKKGLEQLLCDWNIWARWKPESKDIAFYADEVSDKSSLARKLLHSDDPLSKRLHEKIPEEMRKRLDTDTGNGLKSDELRSALIEVLNHLLVQTDLFNKEHFYNVELADNMRDVIERRQQGEDYRCHNRLVLEIAYPNEIAKRWECPFFKVLAEEVRKADKLYSEVLGKDNNSTPSDQEAEKNNRDYREGLVRFFAHKIVIMHPYTDESILSDLLGKIMFWGERSAEAVQASDAACQDWLRQEITADQVLRVRE